MENFSNNSRRQFLGKVAVIATGVAVGPALYSRQGIQVTSLEKEWEVFCENLGGRKSGCSGNATNSVVMQSCAGHKHQTGPAVKFDREDIIAEPTWIYWENNRNKPADLVISFYTDSGTRRFSRINRFELEAINAQMTVKQASDPRTRISVKKLLDERVLVKATIKKNQQLTLAVTNGRHQTIYQRTLNNHS